MNRLAAATSFLLALTAFGSAQIKLDQNNKNLVLLDSVTINYGGKSIASRQLSWRASSKKVDFTVSLASRPATKAIVAVWVLGDPSDNPHAPGQSSKNRNPGKVAFVQDLGSIKDKSTFSIDFGNFAPNGNPGIITFNTGGGTSTEQAAKAMQEMIRKDTKSAIGRNGQVDYVVQVTTADNAASTTATVQYGEFAISSASPKLEFLTTPATSEFGEKWGTETIVNSANATLATFRWTPPKGTTAAEVQVIKESDAQPWAFWNLNSTIIKSAVKFSGNAQQKFSLDLSKLLSFADKSRYIVTVIPQVSASALASHPSTPVFVTLSKEPTQAPQASLQFKTELVGWEPGYEGTPDDKYHFVVADPKHADISDLEKIVGGKVTTGTKVYLPPAEPPKEKAWYKKVYTFITNVINKIVGFVDMVASCVTTMVNMLPQLPFAIAESWGLPKSVSEKAYSFSTLPMKIGSAPLNATKRLGAAKEYVAERMLDDTGITDPNKRAIAKGDISKGLGGWLYINKYAPTGPSQRGLAADPDFEIRTGVAYVRVTATAKGSVPAGFRAQGPTISMEVGTFAKNAELLGTQAQYYPIYTGSAPSPTMAAGQSIIVPVVMVYHSSKQQRPQDWKFGWSYAQSSRYILNGSGIMGKPIHQEWGTNK